jgi:arylsulfatase A-like enzyme
MRIYYAMTANLDWNLGRLIQAIDDLGLRNDTILVFTSDHGELFGAHGRRAKNIFYDEAVRIPFLVRWPGHIPADHRTEVCLNTPDIMPTLLELLDLSIPKEVEGMDLSHCALGRDGPEPDAALMQCTGATAAWQDGHEWRALRDKQFTYAVYRLDQQELLFDNQQDPYQMTTLPDDQPSQGSRLQLHNQAFSRTTLQSYECPQRHVCGLHLVSGPLDKRPDHPQRSTRQF